MKEGASSITGLFIVAVLIFSSFRAYYYGIDIEESRPIRYGGRVSPGDKEFFAFFSKPIAIVLILITSLIHILALKEIFI